MTSELPVLCEMITVCTHDRSTQERILQIYHSICAQDQPDVSDYILLEHLIASLQVKGEQYPEHILSIISALVRCNADASSRVQTITSKRMLQRI